MLYVFSSNTGSALALAIFANVPLWDIVPIIVPIERIRGFGFFEVIKGVVDLRRAVVPEVLSTPDGTPCAARVHTLKRVGVLHCQCHL